MMTQNQPVELLTKAEIAHKLRVTPRTVSKWMICMNLPHLKLGKCVRFDWRAVVDCLNRNYGKGIQL